MKEIMQAQLYQLCRKKSIYILFFLFAAFGIGIVQLLCISSDVGAEAETGLPSAGITAVSEILPNTLYILTSIYIIFMAAVTGEVCAGDFADKTVNYELSSGRLRQEVYFGRAVPAILMSMLGCAVMTAMPYLTAAAMRGWGTKIHIGAALLRCVLVLFPLLRINCFLVCMSFILKKKGIVTALGFVIFYVFSGIMEISFAGDTVVLGPTNLSLLCGFPMHMTFGVDGSVNYIYDTALPASQIVLTVLVSLGAAAAYLLIGYHFFHTDDAN